VRKEKGSGHEGTAILNFELRKKSTEGKRLKRKSKTGDRPQFLQFLDF
jgi:hypothetical protein